MMGWDGFFVVPGRFRCCCCRVASDSGAGRSAKSTKTNHVFGVVRSFSLLLMWLLLLLALLLLLLLLLPFRLQAGLRRLQVHVQSAQQGYRQAMARQVPGMFNAYRSTCTALS